MKFKELIEEVGFARAVIICQPRLPEEFWEELDFGKWYQIYRETAKNDFLHIRAKKNLNEKARTAEELRKVYVMNLDRESALKAFAQAKTFKEFLELRESIGWTQSEELKDVIFKIDQKIYKMAEEIDYEG